MDSGASSSYICTSLITQLRLKPVGVKTKNIEQMYGTVKRRVKIFKCINGEKDILTYLPNPRIKALKAKCSRFSGLTFGDENTEEDRLPVHIILGAADFH